MLFLWIILALGVVLANAGAFLHARSMLTYRDSVEEAAVAAEPAWRVKLRMLLFGVQIPRPVNVNDPSDYNLEYWVREIPRDGHGTLEAWHIRHEAPRGMVVLYHGYRGCKGALLPETAALHEMGYECVLVDFRGSGGSHLAPTSIGFHEAEDVTQSVLYARALQPDLPLILYGRSMGAAAVLRAIQAHELDPDKVILESVFNTLLSTVARRFHLMGLPAFPGAHLLTFWGGVQMGYWGFGHNPVDYAKSVTCPTLMIHGADDPKAPPSQGRAVYDQIAGPKEFVTFEGVAHESNYTQHPAKWRDVMGAFLDGLVKPEA